MEPLGRSGFSHDIPICNQLETLFPNKLNMILFKPDFHSEISFEKRDDCFKTGQSFGFRLDRHFSPSSLIQQFVREETICPRTESGQIICPRTNSLSTTCTLHCIGVRSVARRYDLSVDGLMRH